MELMDKQGFKQTEIGFIPEDWIYCSVGEAVENDYIEKPIDGNHGNIHPKKSDFVQSGIPFIMANNVYNNKVHIDNCNYISKNQADSLQKGFSYTGDVLLTHKGTVGNVAIVGELPCDYIMLTPQVTYYRTKEKIINSYLKGYFESTSFQKKLSMLSGGGTRAYIGIVKQRELPLVFPPTIEEQKAIANALSDVDELITNLNKLIAKKKAIKQGTMQQLLTPPHKGGKRLDGFSGEWEEKRLGDVIIDFQNGYSFSASGYKDEGIPIVTMAQIGLNGQFQYDENKVNYWSIEELKNLKSFTLYIGDVIMSMTDVTPEKNLIGRMTIVNELGPLYLNQRVGHLRVNKNLVNPIILIHLSNMRSWRTYSKSIASLGVQANIGTTDIKNGLLWLPKIEEQNAIAEILSDMDLEIEQLETKKSKYQSIKQGMMQELLTGKTRLI